MSKEELIDFLKSAIEKLTWERFLLMLVLCSCGVLLTFAYENRVEIVESFIGVKKPEEPATWALSPASKTELRAFVDAQPLVGGTLVMDVNLKKNRSMNKFMYLKDSTFSSTSENATTMLPQAFFEIDPKLRAQMIGVINNNFMCYPTIDTALHRGFQQMNRKMPYVCFLAIPPYSGGFVGYTAIPLTKKPTESEIAALRIELTRIAINVYLRDVENQSRVKNQTKGSM